MGSFFTATLYPAENRDDVKNILKDRNFFICSKNENYELVTEEKMDEQNTTVIIDFVKSVSMKTEKPIVSYMVHDSDVLYFVIYKNGQQIFITDNTDAYFSNGELIFQENENIPNVFGIDESVWKNEINEEKFLDCVFVEEFLTTVLNVLNLPVWVDGIGYSYLSEDDCFISDLTDDGVIIEEN